MIDIFNKRWHGIQGCTVGEGKFAMSVIRVQTTDQGPWQALNEDEIKKLLIDHNKAINIPQFDLKAQVKKLGADSLLPPTKKKTKAVAKKKGKKK